MNSSPIPPFVSNAELNSLLYSNSASEVMKNPAIQQMIAQLPPDERKQVSEYIQERAAFDNEVSTRGELDAKLDAGWAKVDDLRSQKTKLQADLEVVTKGEQFIKDAEALKNTTCMGDNIINMAELRDLQNDPGVSQAVRDAARRLLNDPELQKMTQSGIFGAFMTRETLSSYIYNKQLETGKLGSSDAIRAQLTTVSSQLLREEKKLDDLTDRRDAISNGVATQSANAEAQLDVAANQRRAKDIVSSGTTSTSSASNKSGLDGAIENIDNGVKWMESEANRLSALAKSKDPEVRKEALAAFDKIKADLQALMALLKELQQLRSNIIKMYSDISSHIIGNTR